MPLESNGINITNTPPEIEKYSTHKKWCLMKMVHLAKKSPEILCQGLSWVIFKIKFLNFLYDSDSWSCDFKVKFFPLQSDIPITLMCLIVGIGSVSRMLIVLQKVNNVVVRWHLRWMPFLQGGIFDKRNALFVTLRWWLL